VIVGALVQRWTGGALYAPKHGVAVPSDERHSQSRYSFGLFLVPNYLDPPIECLRVSGDRLLADYRRGVLPQSAEPITIVLNTARISSITPHPSFHEGGSSMSKDQDKKTALTPPAWAPRVQRFSRKQLQKTWPRVLTFESALYGSSAHNASFQEIDLPTVRGRMSVGSS
jgi:hypothetical protein